MSTFNFTSNEIEAFALGWTVLSFALGFMTARVIGVRPIEPEPDVDHVQRRRELQAAMSYRVSQ